MGIFPKGTQMANCYVKRCSTSLFIREIQITATVRYDLTLVRMAIFKLTTTAKTSVIKDVERGSESWYSFPLFASRQHPLALEIGRKQGDQVI